MIGLSVVEDILKEKKNELKSLEGLAKSTATNFLELEDFNGLEVFPHLISQKKILRREISLLENVSSKIERRAVLENFLEDRKVALEKKKKNIDEREAYVYFFEEVYNLLSKRDKNVKIFSDEYGIFNDLERKFLGNGLVDLLFAIFSGAGEGDFDIFSYCRLFLEFHFKSIPVVRFSIKEYFGRLMQDKKSLLMVSKQLKTTVDSAGLFSASARGIDDLYKEFLNFASGQDYFDIDFIFGLRETLGLDIGYDVGQEMVVRVKEGHALSNLTNKGVGDLYTMEYTPTATVLNKKLINASEMVVDLERPIHEYVIEFCDNSCYKATITCGVDPRAGHLEQLNCE